MAFFQNLLSITIMSTLEYSQTLTVPAGSNAASVTFSPDEGTIVGCSIYGPATVDNPGTVRAKIKDNAGREVSMLQNIANYRNRETAYKDGFKPIEAFGGRPMTFEIIADQNFDSDTSYDLVLVYNTY